MVLEFQRLIVPKGFKLILPAVTDSLCCQSLLHMVLELLLKVSKSFMPAVIVSLRCQSLRHIILEFHQLI
ncbi:hypothetical protein BDA96_08G003900 [Sorghum bicolor]|uniref:Uncharacterized protein n=1 Tax=Sorghum bicolor TaxID=4558 RepID=A0A921QFM4_SORBI|nr:hypothetical protein BDA96_08G003900 [Sorghum bicolor]